MESTNIKDIERKGFRIKVIIILLIVLLIPIGILTLLYNINQTFKKNANELLAKMPGVVGSYFANIPTEMERKDKIHYLSSYYIELDPNTAAEKIYILKKDDEKLYVDLIKNMNSISISKLKR